MTLNVDFKNETCLVAELQENGTCLQSEFILECETLNSEFVCEYKALNAELKCESKCMCGTFQEFQVLQGRTPIKGVDYFTEEDVDEIAEKAYELVQTGGVDTSTFLKVSQIGKHLELDASKKLNVITTDVAESGNNTPITSSAVNTIVGNIDILLGII